MKRPIRLGAIFSLLLLTAAECSSGEEAGAQGPPGPPGMAMGPVEVGIVSLAGQEVTRTAELPGRVTATAVAEIRPEVDGIVRERVFREGAEVAEGDVLYRLDATRFEAARRAAEAAVRRAEAGVASAQAKLQRVERLARSSAASTQELEDARTTLLQGQADLEGAQADLQTADINLSNATIRAPIAGIIGTSAVSVGSLVTANQAEALATIRQIDPVYVDLVDSSANLLRIRDEILAGTLGESDAAPSVRLVLENGRAYELDGVLSLAESVVSETTGTFMLRATFDNPERVLMPGMFVRAQVDLGVMRSVFLVPQRSVIRNAAGEATAYFVTADGRAEQRVLTTSGSVGSDWIVTAGAAGGDRLIVDGLQKISDGAQVVPVDVAIGDNGVVLQELAPAGLVARP